MNINLYLSECKCKHYSDTVFTFEDLRDYYNISHLPQNDAAYYAIYNNIWGVNIPFYHNKLYWLLCLESMQ